MSRPRRKRLKMPQRKGGAAASYTNVLYGTRTTRLSYPDGSELSDEVRVPATVIDYVAGVSQAGDFKHPNPHAFNKTTLVALQGISTNASATVNYTASGVFDYPSVGLIEGDYQSAYNTALDSLYEQLRGNVDLSIDLAEVHKTKSMMRQTLKGMASLLTTFRKMRRSNPRDWGNLWLEFTYGWKPLANTIYEGLSKACDASASPPWHVRARGSDKNSDSEVIGTDIRTINVRHGSVRYQLDVLYKLSDSRLQQLGGYTSLNPVSIAWELVPYSFVVDWFVDVGGYLRNLESAFLYGSDFVGGYITRTDLSESTQTIIGTSDTGDGSYSTVSLQGSYKRVSKSRGLLGGTPYPMTPTFDPKMGTSRLISAAALLGQGLKSLKH